MHSLFERISNLLFDLCHFIAALNGERIPVGFHIIEEHERLVQQFISCGLPHHVSLVIVEFGKDMLAELYYHEADTVGQPARDELLNKAFMLFDYVETHGDTFSIERRNKMTQIRQKSGDVS